MKCQSRDINLVVHWVEVKIRNQFSIESTKWNLEQFSEPLGYNCTPSAMVDVKTVKRAKGTRVLQKSRLFSEQKIARLIWTYLIREGNALGPVAEKD